MLNLKRSIRPIQLFYSHINRAQTVTTWSHLANHFNSKPEEDRWAFLKCERTVSYFEYKIFGAQRKIVFFEMVDKMID